MKKITEINGAKKMSKKEQQSIHGGNSQGSVITCQTKILSSIEIGVSTTVTYFCDTSEGQSCGSQFYWDDEQPTGSFCTNS